MIEVMEEFRPIKGTDGRYFVSDKGEVISAYARRNVSNHPTENYMPRTLKQIDNGNGYRYVTVHINTKRRNVYVHRAVAEAFLEPVEGKEYVNHKDYDKTNNCVSNLEWCTQAENVRHSACHHPKQHNVSPSKHTGIKYIQMRNGKYRVVIKKSGVDKHFETLGEAIHFRNEALHEIGYSI